MRRSDSPLRRRCRGFSLLEVLISTAVLAIVLVIVMQVVGGTGTIWKGTTGRAEQFREGRSAIEALTRTISQATLNPAWDYDRTSSTAPPTDYLRQSELRFTSGPSSALGLGANRFSHGIFFQAPLGLTRDSNKYAELGNVLNTSGFFIEFGSDASYRPDFLDGAIPERHRFRLVEMRQPAEELTIYEYTSGADGMGQPKAITYTGKDWYQGPLGATVPPTTVLAENVIAMVILPKLSQADQDALGVDSDGLAPDFFYDTSALGAGSTHVALSSRNQFPPLVEIRLVVIDEASAGRFENGSAVPDYGVGDLFETDAGSVDDQMLVLEERLRDLNISYEILSVTIAVTGAKWSMP